MSVDVTQLATHVVVSYLGAEVVERGGRAQSAVSPVVVVRAQSVVATALHVERRQVLGHVVRQREQTLRQLRVHHLQRSFVRLPYPDNNGRRAFSVAGPMTWNSLPDFIRDKTSSTDCFMRLLKTYLFAQY